MGKVKIDDNIEGIARSLAVTEVRGKAVGKLIELYERIPKEKDDLCWVFGLAVSVSALFTVPGGSRRLNLSMIENYLL
ncbi:hypothetical protein [Sphingobacterium cellulitidis]|uniref:hypothetical protein n=1 Tax=Sphingobacterium cellulitidis TaxID=1768011 RepID=UPI000B942096|nr:hypothetical protein CHT99_16735 [Sphingobacterium cellulitidis]